MQVILWCHPIVVLYGPPYPIIHGALYILMGHRIQVIFWCLLVFLVLPYILMDHHQSIL